jgi:hypothetical protein
MYLIWREKIKEIFRFDDYNVVGGGKRLWQMR